MVSFMYRGPKVHWFVSFMPEGFLINDNKGIRSVPWSQVQGVVARGKDVVIQTAAGSLVVSCEFYRILPKQFVERCQQLMSLASK